MAILGKSYFKIKINNIDITDTLNVIVDSIRWKDISNSSCIADFDLALPYDSPSKPSSGQSVEILFNNIRKFYGYITTISTSSNPEGISIHCEDEYYILNKETVDFYIGRQEPGEGEYFSTYKLALAALNFNYDIGDFIPQDESYIQSGKADIISDIVAKCGNFLWYIQPDGTYKLWTGGQGTVITLNRQILNSNLGEYDIISHSLIESDENKIDKLKVIMGDMIAVGWDNLYMGIGLITIFIEKADEDPNIYTRQYISSRRWIDGRNLTGEKEVIKNKDGWVFTIPPGYEATGFGSGWIGSSYDPLQRAPVTPKYPGFFTQTKYSIADENIEDVQDHRSSPYFGGVYPEARHRHIFYVGEGNIIKTLNLSGLNIQYGITYNTVINSEDVNYQVTIKHGDTLPPTPSLLLQFLEIIIPSWDDTAYATDLATMEYYKYKDTKISGQIQVTFDCIEYYGIDLTKRITIDGICTGLNIKSIDYDVSSYLVTIHLESENYYKRSVSIPSHT